jgi:hypothetical protein
VRTRCDLCCRSVVYVSRLAWDVDVVRVGVPLRVGEGELVCDRCRREHPELDRASQNPVSRIMPRSPKVRFPT